MRKLTTAAALALALAASTVMLVVDQAGATGACGFNPTIVDGTASITVPAECGPFDIVAYAYNPAATEQLELGDDITPSLPQTKHDEATTSATDLTATVDLPCGFSQIDVLIHGTNPAVLDQAFIDSPAMADFVARFRGGNHATVVCAPVEPPAPPVPPTPPAPPVPPEIATQVIVRAPVTPPAPAYELPRTGTGTGPLAAAGFGLLAAGALLTAKSRRMKAVTP